MSKVDLAKKTAKLMIDKLSPQELENELYQLLIILSNNDLDYMYEDVKKGEVAGPPHPVDVLQGGDDRDDEDSMYQDEIKKAITILDEDKGATAQKAIAVLKPIKSEMPVELREQYDEFVKQNITIGEMLGALGFFTRAGKRYADFDVGDFVYAYDAGMDRWLPYTIEEFRDGDELSFVTLKEYFAGAPSGDVGQGTINYDGELRAQPEDKVFLLNDYLYKNNGKDFVKYIKHQDYLAEKNEGGQLIKDIYIEHNGIVNIEWNDKRMKNYQTQATPFWQGEDEIGVQVTHNESGEEVPFPDLDIIPTSVYWPNSESFNIGNHVYPNNPDDFYYAYWDLLPEILEISLSIVEENEE